VFARKADDGLASFVKRLDDLVAQNAAKKAKGTVVLLGKKEDFAERLTAIAKEKKLAQVPLTVSKDGAAGPDDYKLAKNVVFTVVVYNKKQTVTSVLTFADFDAKSQDAALAAFAAALDVPAPKADPPKADPPKKD